MNASKFNALYQQALSTFGTDQVYEFVTECAGVPWFAVTLDGVVLIAEHCESDDLYALKTSEHEYLIEHDGNAGADEIWVALQCVARALGCLDAPAVDGDKRPLTSKEEARVMKNLERRGLTLSEQVA